MMRVKKSKAKTRLQRDTKEISDVIRRIADGNVDAYIGYRRLYAIYCGRSGVHEELKVFFQIPGIEPDGNIRVDDAFRERVRTLASKYLSEHSS